MVTVLFDKNDHTIRVIDLKRTDTDVFVIDAVVTVVMVDSNDVPVSGPTWPLALAYVSGTDGEYMAVIDKAAVENIGDFQELQITAVKDSIDAYWQIPLQVVKRTS